MKNGITTGEAAAKLGVTEPRLNDLVRRGKLKPAPAVVGNKRVWQEGHIEQARKCLAECGQLANATEAKR